jgi:hypothetical protein
LSNPLSILTQPTIPDDLTNIVEPSVNTDAAATIPGFLTDIVIEGSSTPSGNPATIPEKAGDTLSNIANNPEQTPKSREQLLLKFKKEFMDAMPQYKGASEEEKWLTVMNAGLQIAAGTSPNAITNIANGLKGLGAEFAKNEKEKRLWDQKVELSAAKYGLESVALEDAKEEALAKEGRSYPWKLIASKDFTDPLTGKQVLAGQAYAVTKAKLDSGILQELPLTFTNVYAANAKMISETAKKLLKASDKARELNTIGYKEADAINTRLIKTRESFVHSTGGRALLEKVIKQLVLNPDSITGAEGAAKKLWSDALNFMNIKDKPKSYETRERLEVDLKMAFQKLIPVALRNIQAGNSISNRDVTNLANAFIAGGFINQNKDGTFSINRELVGKNPKVLVYQLQKTNDIFREGQRQALVTFDQEMYNISKLEPGRYDIRYFEPRLRSMRPALEKYRKGTKSPTPTASSILNVSDYFDLKTGKLLKPLPRIP